ncbi:hypothetical protein BJ875DRAFT_283104 [Amylocarpus encephaloides]|uniref:Uncharacterized protein n=1 Tax=Amylocarpus encephaloides TaxID=45428 RepID=A0A9P7YK99_9HELO|nr:hypothetical protein BJ875DRAFT_283104 [Amylocarpus encephaloides]
MEATDTHSRWPFNEDSYTSDLEHGLEIESAFSNFTSHNLSGTTSVQVLIGNSDGTIAQDEVLDERGFHSTLIASHDLYDSYRFFFINRFLVDTDDTPPPDARRLRISSSALQYCISRLSLSPAFIHALARYFLPAGQAFRSDLCGPDSICDFWYFLPVRMQVRCTDQVAEHTASTAGSNQMDPFNYLHLPDRRADIRGHQIALYTRYNKTRNSTTLIVFDFIDGRWSRAAREPCSRLREGMGQYERLSLFEDMFSPHLVFLTSAMRWWSGAFDSLNSQLIKYERRLQDQRSPADEARIQREANKALHAMAAHLHRYCSELKSIANSLAALKTYHARIYVESEQGLAWHRLADAFLHIESQLTAITNFEAELEKKIQNILALLFNRMTQEQTNQAQKLAWEMKIDSLSMKTIAVLTMFFLPGTSFAALLAMPFFTSNTWLSQTRRFWVWVVLTVPSTSLAFLYYLYWKKRGEGRSPDSENTIPLNDPLD